MAPNAGPSPWFLSDGFRAISFASSGVCMIALAAFLVWGAIRFSDAPLTRIFEQRTSIADLGRKAFSLNDSLSKLVFVSQDLNRAQEKLCSGQPGRADDGGPKSGHP